MTYANVFTAQLFSKAAMPWFCLGNSSVVAASTRL